MGNQVSNLCIECCNSEQTIDKSNIDQLIACGYPFCKNDIRKNNTSTVTLFNNIIYCSSDCRILHKQLDYIGLGFNKYSGSTLL